MPEYIIEARLAGYAKEHFRRLVYSAGRRFNIKGVSKDYVPSIIIYGPANSTHEGDLIRAVEEVGSRCGLVSYRIRGFSHFDAGKKWFFNDMRGICLDIEPAESLKRMRTDLAGRLDEFCEVQAAAGDGGLQAVVEFGELDAGRFDELLAYFKANEERDISQRLLRLTVVRGGQQICEYDLIRRKMTGRARLKEHTALSAALGQIRLHGEEALQPIWGRARQLARRRRRGRQLTLVEDNPSIRIPKVFLHGARGVRRALKRSGARQLRLVDDSPAVRIPKVFTMRGEKRHDRAADDRTVQKRLTTDDTQRKAGIMSPLMGIPGMLRRRRA